VRIKKRTLRLIGISLAVIAISVFIIIFLNKDPYDFSGDKLHYSQNRGNANYEMKLINSTDKLYIYALNFKSKNFLQYETKIYSLLFMPKDKKNIPGIVLLPGGGVKKEDEGRIAKIIADEGYAVLTFDQRGIGETGGYYFGMRQDYEVFSSGKEPVQHLSVYDALKAFDVLSAIKDIDKKNVAVGGESMGGRYAIIAAAIEKRFTGALIISSSGFHIGKENTPENPYLLSIDPDHYIADISPRPIFMLHGTNDTTIKPDDAKYTFALAKEPKDLFFAQGCGHGYCDKMRDKMIEDLKVIFGKSYINTNS
jgi:uncharacterized protein